MTVQRRALTDNLLKNLKAADLGKRYAISDTLCPGLKVRVTDKGTRTFILWRRFGGAANPSARSLGEVGVISLADAREKARGWLSLAKAGKDPAEVAAEQEALERAARMAEAAKAKGTFGRLLLKYFDHITSQRQRRAAGVMADMRRDLLPFWEHTPVHALTRKDVKDRVRVVAKRSVHQAYAAFGNTKTFFNWLRDEEEYGLEVVPTDGMRAKTIVGHKKKSRDRVLNDDEIFAFWRAAGRTPNPLGAGYKVLLLTAARLNEIFEADRRELDPAGTKLTVPPERFKSDKYHFVQLSKQAAEIIAALPRWNTGTYIFSKDGIRPARIWTKDKKRLDARMLRTLKAIARVRGENPANVMLKSFVIHDLRRTARSRLSALKVPHEVKELILGHELQGLDKTYDIYGYEPEMREALERWSGLISKISSTPFHTNVLALQKVDKAGSEKKTFAAA